MSDRTKELMIKVLFQKGSLIGRESYYGDLTDRDLHEKIKLWLLTDKIHFDFDKSEYPKTEDESRFEGTFVDSSWITYLKAEIHFKGPMGKQNHLFKWEFNSDMEFSEVINLILEFSNAEDR